MEYTSDKKKILILGSAVIDVIINISRLPKPGEDINGKHMGNNVGGCAYNVSKILDYLKMPHDLCVPLGAGMYANIIKEELKKSGHSVLIEDPSADNGYSLSLVENNGERTFITIDGIETMWRKNWFDGMDVQKYDYIYVSGYGFQDTGNSGDVILDFLAKKKAGSIIVLDPGPRLLGDRFKNKLLHMDTVLELNEQEALALSGMKTIKEAVKNLFDITGQPVIVTLGSRGTLYYTGDKQEVVPAVEVKAIDTIGAGDSHTAAVIAGLASGYDIRRACILANETAAKVVQHVGCCIA